MRIVFCMLPGHGHINPTLPVAQELVRRGAHVSYLTTAAFASAVRNAGAVFHPIGDVFGMPDQATLTGDGSSDGGAPSTRLLVGVLVRTLARHLRYAPALIERLRAAQPDLLVYDPMCLWGRAAAHALRVPAASFSSSVALSGRSALLGQFMAALLPPSPALAGGVLRLLWASERLHRRYGIPRVNPRTMMLPAEGCNIIPVPREFQPDEAQFDSRFVFVGPLIASRGEPADLSLELDGPGPLAYVSLGTSLLNRQPHFFRTCLDAFGGTPWRVLISGTVPPEAKIPPNVQVRAYVPQLEVLQRAAVFVTHGGMNSTMEGLWHGVPLVVVPQMIEQAATADRVAELGLGVRLDGDTIGPRALRQAVEHVAHDHLMSERIARLRVAMREAGGVPRAADALEACATPALVTSSPRETADR